MLFIYTNARDYGNHFFYIVANNIKILDDKKKTENKMKIIWIDRIEKLLNKTRLDIEEVRDVYHEILLENAIGMLQHGTYPKKQNEWSYVEEFLRNAVILLELGGSELDARFQIDVARSIIR